MCIKPLNRANVPALITAVVCTAATALLMFGNQDHILHVYGTERNNEYGHNETRRIGARERFEEFASLVDACAKTLQLSGVENDCVPGQHESVVQFNAYSVPYMTSSGDMHCGFEGLMTKEAVEELAEEFVFRFVGDSTVRRLAESFSSIYTGLAYPHVVRHKRTDLSSGTLKIIFDWAPTCTGPSGVGPMVAKAMREEEKENEEQHQGSGDDVRGRRTVIITAYGNHDANYIRDFQALPLSLLAPDGNGTARYDMYVKARERGKLAIDYFNTASLQSCHQVTDELAQVAAIGARPSTQPLWNGGRALKHIAEARSARQGAATRPSGTGNAANTVNLHVGSKTRVSWNERTLSATTANNVSRSASRARPAFDHGEDQGMEADEGPEGCVQGVLASKEDKRMHANPPSSLPPLVFILQNNPYISSDSRWPWVTDLQEFQRRKAAEHNGGDSCGRRAQLLDVRQSLYERLWCYRADHIHFLEPVKLIEAKMLWHLIALF